jgi:hypothetical protein
MEPSRRAISFAFVAAVLALALAASADAKSFDLIFAKTTARPGDIVTASSSFRVWPGLARVVPSVVVYLIPTRLGHADYNTGWSVLPPPGSRGTYRLGRMGQRSGRLFLRFTMPRLRPGDYMTASWCPPRACGSAAGFVASALWGASWTGKRGDVIRVPR